ncbi:MotE family protein [Candidatus Nitrospira bockiana]
MTCEHVRHGVRAPGAGWIARHRAVPWLAWSIAALSVVGYVVMAGLGSWAGSPAAPDGPTRPLDTDGPGPAEERPRLQGPALETPQEILDMLAQRQRALERREEAVRTAEARLAVLRQEIAALVDRYEQATKAAQAAQEAAQKKLAQARQSTALANAQAVAKIYETMPAEEAADRIGRMPTDLALQVLRAVKGKTAGAILAQVQPEKAAKLTALYLAPPASKEGRAAR